MPQEDLEAKAKGLIEKGDAAMDAGEYDAAMDHFFAAAKKYRALADRSFKEKDYEAMGKAHQMETETHNRRLEVLNALQTSLGQRNLEPNSYNARLLNIHTQGMDIYADMGEANRTALKRHIKAGLYGKALLNLGRTRAHYRSASQQGNSIMSPLQLLTRDQHKK